MKTNSFSTKKTSIYSLFGLSALLLASCGSYNNSSYYDNDGIYGSKTQAAQTQQSTESNKYKEYFSTLNKENEEVFTDVENYSTQNDSLKTSEANNVNGWGANPSTTTVIVYDNYWNNWYGPSWTWGWGWNSWYGPSWGWGWNNWYGPSWGWGWNNWYGPSWGWGWNNPYYGYWGYNGYYNNHYAYAHGRRDTRSYYNYNNRYTASGRGIGRQATVTPTRYNTPTTRANTSRGNAYDTRPVRANSTAPGRNYNYNSQANPGRANTTMSPSRNNTYTPNTQTTPPTRSNTNTQTAPPSRDYSPSRSNDVSPSRSYSPSSGGGNYGGGGGGRSGGGGGGGRR